jgi:hypothetical protein
VRRTRPRAQGRSAGELGQDGPPGWIAATLFTISLIIPAIPSMLALVWRVKLVGENFMPLMSIAGGISVASLTALGVAFGRVYLVVNVQREADVLPKRTTLDVEVTEQLRSIEAPPTRFDGARDDIVSR